MTQRPLSPLQGTRTHSTVLSQEVPRTTCSHGKYQNHSSDPEPRSETTTIPNDEFRRCPSLSEKNDPGKLKQSGGHADKTDGMPGFFPCLSKLAFAQAIKSDVFLPKLNVM
jgi:hypothetical protein